MSNLESIAMLTENIYEYHRTSTLFRSFTVAIAQDKYDFNLGKCSIVDVTTTCTFLSRDYYPPSAFAKSVPSKPHPHSTF